MDALKQVNDIQNAVATPFNDLNLVIETFDKTAGEPSLKIVRNLVEVIV